jgi:hypothetical protein
VAADGRHYWPAVEDRHQCKLQLYLCEPCHTCRVRGSTLHNVNAANAKRTSRFGRPLAASTSGVALRPEMNPFIPAIFDVKWLTTGGAVVAFSR